MDEISKSIANNIKTGQYFSDVRKWYAHKYLYPITERSLLVMVFFLTLIAFLVVLYTFNALFPLQKEVPFVIKVEDSLDYFSTIHPLSKDSEQPQQSITNYLLGEYVIAYEAYSFKDLARNEARIRNSSSKRVFKTYSHIMSTSNPDSPVVIYQRTATRTIKILSIELVPDESEISRAIVRFQATWDNRLEKKKIVNTYKADITFLMSDINKIAITKEPLEFIVTDYQVRQLK